MDEKRFTKDLFNKPGHREILTDQQAFTYDSVATTISRRDCLHLICTLSEKYSTVLKNVSTACNDPKCSAGCCSGNQYCTVITDNDGSSVDNACTYHDEEPETDTTSVTSSNSESLFLPDNDDDIKIDDSDDLYSMRKNNLCYIGDTEGDRDDNNEDSSVDEVYSDYHKA